MTDQRTSGRMGSNRRAVLKGIGVGAVGFTAGCIGTEGEATATETMPGTVTLGQPAALTGKWDFLQPAVSDATDLALSEIEEAGGPGGTTLDLKRRDTAVEVSKARQVTRQLVNNDDARAILGLFSSEIEPLWDFLQDQETPVVTPWPGSTFLDENGGDKGTPGDVSDDQWVWRTIIGDTVHTIGAAKYMLDQDFGTMGVLNGTSSGERSWADSFIDAYENNGGTVAKRVEVAEGKSSYQSELDKLFDADFDAWAMAVALEDAKTVISNWADGGYGKQLLMEDGLKSEDLISAVGEEAEGAWIAAGTSQGPNYDAFIEKFQESSDADIHPWGVAAYDATNVVALAMHRAGSADPGAIQQNVGPVAREGGTKVSTFQEGKEALDAGDEVNYQGAATPVQFTDHGNVFGSVGVSEVTPDGFQQIDTVPASDLRGLVGDY